MGTKKTASKRIVTDGHKLAMAAGRINANNVRKYLEALENNRPKRGRKRTAESIQKQLDAIRAAIAAATKV